MANVVYQRMQQAESHAGTPAGIVACHVNRVDEADPERAERNRQYEEANQGLARDEAILGGR